MRKFWKLLQGVFEIVMILSWIVFSYYTCLLIIAGNYWLVIVSPTVFFLAYTGGGMIKAKFLTLFDPKNRNKDELDFKKQLAYMIPFAVIDAFLFLQVENNILYLTAKQHLDWAFLFFTITGMIASFLPKRFTEKIDFFQPVKRGEKRTFFGFIGTVGWMVVVSQVLIFGVIIKIIDVILIELPERMLKRPKKRSD